MSEPFDVIPYNVSHFLYSAVLRLTICQDIKGDWKRLGAGSFGNVYKGQPIGAAFNTTSGLTFIQGSYLGIDVAIKEVLPSNEYDVAKYFEREWRLMKECRHPNICLFIGLSRAPDPDNRIFIITEYIENGNVRLYIHDKMKPFPWRLRLSFATDVTRALAYLHARKCIHRDLKGENLLVTSNGRIKVTDFGFARIAARNEEESKRLTFCGTDSYMSPEILLGDEFDLPTDVFSLGIIFCEIAARKLADDTHFKRHPPDFGIDVDEVRKRASPDCPPDFVNLCLDCLSTDPMKRPTTRIILERLQQIEQDVLLRPEEGENVHVGSIKFMSGAKRPSVAPRIPSFGMGVGKDIRTNGEENTSSRSCNSSSEEDSDEELIEALSKIGINPDSHWSGDSTTSGAPLLDTPVTPAKNDTSSFLQQYSTTVVRSHVTNVPSSLSSVLTIKPSPDPNVTPAPVLPPSDTPSPADSSQSYLAMNDASTFSIATMDTYHTAPGSAISSALATEGGSTIRTIGSNGSIVGATSIGSRSGGGMHRFTSIKPGTKPRKLPAGSGAAQSGFQVPRAGGGGAKGTGEQGLAASTSASAIGGFAWNPLDLFFSSGLLMAKCDVCFKRLGWRPVMACDDCGMKYVSSHLGFLSFVEWFFDLMMLSLGHMRNAQTWHRRTVG
jgi:LIM domain kinase 1